MSVLTATEQIRLHEQEARVTQAFYEAGQALTVIRDERLYRANYRSFEDYCVDRWQLHRNYVNKMIRAGSVIENLGTNGTQLPDSERVTRPLAELEPEQQQPAWEAAQTIAAGKKPTASHTSRAAAAAKSGSGAAIGQTVTVLDEDSAHYGKEVTIVSTASNGLIVSCQVEGEEQPQPFLVNEVGPQQLSSTKPAPTPPQAKTSPIEALQVELEIERARVAILEKVLSQMVVAIRSGSCSEAVLAEAEQLLA